MKLRLKVRWAMGAGQAEGRAFDWDFDKGKHPLIAGKSKQAGILLPHPTVSDKHFSVEPGKERYQVKDLGSLNGTCLNGSRLTPNEWSPIAPGDVLSVGPFVISILDPKVDSLESGGVCTKSFALELARQMLDSDPEERPSISVVKGPDKGTHFSLPLGQPVVIGRDPGCHMPVADPDVSRSHVKIYCTLDGCWLSDLKSKNGVFVENRAITGAWKLEHGQHIKLGATLLVFIDPAEIYLGSLEKMAEQIIGDQGGVFETGVFSNREGESIDEVLSKEAVVLGAVPQVLSDKADVRGSRGGDASKHNVNSPKENMDSPKEMDPVAEALSVAQCSKNEPGTAEDDQNDCDNSLKDPTGDIGSADEARVFSEQIEGEVTPNDADGPGLEWVLLIALGVIVVVGAGVALIYLIKIL